MKISGMDSAILLVTMLNAHSILVIVKIPRLRKVPPKPVSCPPSFAVDDCSLVETKTTFPRKSHVNKARCNEGCPFLWIGDGVGRI